MPKLLLQSLYELLPAERHMHFNASLPHKKFSWQMTLAGCGTAKLTFIQHDLMLADL